MDCSLFTRVSSSALAAYLGHQRWYGGKAEAPARLEVSACVPLAASGLDAVLLLVDAGYRSGRSERYAAPLVPVASAGDAPYPLTVEIAGSASPLTFSDALHDKRFALFLLECIREGASINAGDVSMAAQPLAPLPRLLAASGPLDPRLLGVEQTNTSIRFGERLILKFFRRLEEGENLDVETGRFLTETAHFEHTPPLAGLIEIRRAHRSAATLAVLNGYVPNLGDAWKHTLESLDEFFNLVDGRSIPAGAAPPPFTVPEEAVSELAAETIGPYLDLAALLGQRTAELHLALASEQPGRPFSPEPLTPGSREAAFNSMAQLALRAFSLLRDRLQFLDPRDRALAALVLARQKEAIAEFDQIRTLPDLGQRTRIHGDYHLGQVLFTGSDFSIIDFEGEPERALAERGAKRFPLADVAGMLRSFHYAASTALRRREQEDARTASKIGSETGEESPLAAWSQYWRRWTSAEFLRAYCATAGQAGFLPRDPEAIVALLRVVLLEKAAYEIIYELKNRPDWVRIPLDGFLAAL